MDSRKGGKYRVSTPNAVHAKHTTKAKAKAQARLINAVDHGWKPTGKKAKRHENMGSAEREVFSHSGEPEFEKPPLTTEIPPDIQKQITDLVVSHSIGSDMDAGFDAGEFSGPAHSEMEEEALRMIAHENNIPLEDVMTFAQYYVPGDAYDAAYAKAYGESLTEGYQGKIMQVLKAAGIRGAYFSGGTLYVPDDRVNDAGEALENAEGLLRLPPVEPESEDHGQTESLARKLLTQVLEFNPMDKGIPAQGDRGGGPGPMVNVPPSTPIDAKWHVKRAIERLGELQEWAHWNSPGPQVTRMLDAIEDSLGDALRKLS